MRKGQKAYLENSGKNFPYQGKTGAPDSRGQHTLTRMNKRIHIKIHYNQIVNSQR